MSKLMNERLYTLNFIKALEKKEEVTGVFTPTFGDLSFTDGIENNETAFTVKKGPRKVKLQVYSTDPNTAMGNMSTGFSRYGEINERIYTNFQVPYERVFSINEGIDLVTVNNALQTAVAEVLVQYSEGVMDEFNMIRSKTLLENAGVELDLNSYGEDDLINLFDEAQAHYVNHRFSGTRYAYVTPKVYSKLTNLRLIQNVLKTNTSHVDVGLGSIDLFKGFIIQQVPEQFMGDADVIFALDDIAFNFIGITRINIHTNTPLFAGTLVQGLMKYGTYLPEDNRQAIVKAPKVEETTDGETTRAKTKATK